MLVEERQFFAGGGLIVRLYLRLTFGITLQAVDLRHTEPCGHDVPGGPVVGFLSGHSLFQALDAAGKIAVAGQLYGGLVQGAAIAFRGYGITVVTGGAGGLFAAGSQAQDHSQGQQQGDELFHVVLSFSRIFLLTDMQLKYTMYG